jgi:hypothetical protein
MANLGSSNTPISGESFDLPSGWSFEENVDGEVIITDSGGTTIGRRDETNGEWVFDSIVSDTLEANTELNGPTASEGDVVTLPSNPDVVPIFFDAQTGQPLVPDLEETI